MRLCIDCGKEKRSNNGNYCRDCYQRGKRNHMFGTHRSRKIKTKISETMKGINKGKNNPRWKGGKTKDGHGYIYVHNPNHPYAINNGYVKRSRLIMEQILGRYLLPEEIVHHRNETKNDDRAENLKLFSCRGEHISFHNKG